MKFQRKLKRIEVKRIKNIIEKHLFFVETKFQNTKQFQFLPKIIFFSLQMPKRFSIPHQLRLCSSQIVN